MKVETAIGNACIKDMKEHNGTYIPQTLYLASPYILQLTIPISKMTHQMENLSFMELDMLYSKS